MNNELFLEELKKIDIHLNEKQISDLDKYYNLLIEWNEKINLTAITDKKEVYLKHFYDSLTLFKAYNLNENISLCDVGTGAGFPGIVLKICFPSLKVVLVDALEKRINFLKKVVQELDLNNIEIYHDRAETFAKNHREEFDIVTSRAVARLNILNEICLPMVKENGYFIPMKAKIDEELTESNNSLKELNGKVTEIISFNLPIEGSTRNIIKINKLNKNNIKYPRNFDKIKKNPL